MINIYCDESNHLLKSPPNSGDHMVLGAISCSEENKKEALQRIREIKEENNLPKNFEIKWTKVSPSKEDFYLDLVNYFFDSGTLSYRGLVANKSTLNHEVFHQTHDDWYYRMYFYLLRELISPNEEYSIYVDIKDTLGGQKVLKLQEVLSNSQYDFNREIINKIQQIRSYESELLQLADFFTGALQHLNNEGSSATKQKIISRIQERTGYSLEKSTLLNEKKFNLFFWKGKNGNEE